MYVLTAVLKESMNYGFPYVSVQGGLSASLGEYGSRTVHIWQANFKRSLKLGVSFVWSCI